MITSAITAPIVTSRVPVGSVRRKPTCTVFSASPRNELSALIASAPSTAPQRLADAAEDEHRQRDERQVEIEEVGRDQPELVHVAGRRRGRRARR